MGWTSKDLESTIERVQRLREKYDLLRRRLRRTDGTDDIERLDVAIARRRARVRHLDEQIDALDAERERLKGEIVGCLHGAEALLIDLVDRLESLDGPCWAPTPIVGYSRFDVVDGALDDGDHTWDEWTLRPACPDGRLSPPHENGACRDGACGVLVWKALDQLPDVSGAKLAALVEVSVSGRIVEHDLGYRGEFGRITALIAFDGGRWFRTRDTDQIEWFTTAPLEAFAELSAPIPDDGMLYLEADLFFGERP
jgi:hypothetical protein